MPTYVRLPNIHLRNFIIAPKARSSKSPQAANFCPPSANYARRKKMKNEATQTPHHSKPQKA
jgi:hypothetical protein